MSELATGFAVGDSVIATTCLVADPLVPHGVRVEIPLACRGTVVEVRTVHYQRPFVVVFDVGEGGTVEIKVSADQIAPVMAHEPVPWVRTETRTLAAALDSPSFRRQLMHRPSRRYPHHRCRPWHAANFILLCGLYGLFLERFLPYSLIGTAAMLVTVYGHQLYTYRSWAWVPAILRPDEPLEGERLQVDRHRAHMAWSLDVLFVVTAFLLVVSHAVNTVNPSNTGTLVYYALLGALAVVWLTQFVMHEVATRIVPD